LGDVAARESVSGCFEDPEDSDRAAELAQSPAIGGDMLAMEGSDTQKLRSSSNARQNHPAEMILLKLRID